MRRRQSIALRTYSFQNTLNRFNLSVVSPLMKGGGGLVVFQTLENGAVDDHFVVLDLPADNSVTKGTSNAGSQYRRGRVGRGE